MTDKEEEKWWEDCVEVRVNVVLPAKLAGDDFPEGAVVGFKKLIDECEWRATWTPVDIVERTLHEMVDAVIARLKEEVERGSER